MPRTEREVRLRDMSQDQLLATYANDRFTATVLSARMRYIVQHMCSGLLNTAFSPILRDWYDFSATIVGPPADNYPMSTVSNSMSCFVGHMAEQLRVIVEEFGPDELEPGDVIICNDPYRVGNHVNDISFTRPVFHEGRIVAFVSMKAHQLDVGGAVPAGFSAATKNVFEGGLVLPPMLLFHGDRPVRSAFNLIFDNSRFGALLRPDMLSIHQQLRLGEQLLTETIQRYGVDAFLGAIRYSCDVTAELIADSIRAKIPDGVYEADQYLDADGVDDDREYRVHVTIKKYGERLEIDLSGTSEQARTCINGGPFDAKSAVIVALKMLLDPLTPLTSGSFRTIDLVIPPGTLCSAEPPDGAIFLYWESSVALLEAVYRALADALGADAIGGDFGAQALHNGSGVGPDGAPFVSVGQCGGEHGPWGATKVADGDSYQVVHVGNNLDPATEAIEAEVPAVLLRKDYAIDTAGAGYNRGGAAVVKDVLWLAAGEHWLTPMRTKQTAGAGVYGGGDAPAQGVWLFPPDVYAPARERSLPGFDDATYQSAVPVAGVLNPTTNRIDKDGEFFYHGRHPVWRTDPGATFRYVTGGGGGWGKARDRDPQRVLRDVRDEYVSIEAARELYGVAVVGDPANDPEGLVVDEAETARLRTERQATTSAL